jgi:hypothetical protein
MRFDFSEIRFSLTSRPRSAKRVQEIHSESGQPTLAEASAVTPEELKNLRPSEISPNHMNG